MDRKELIDKLKIFKKKIEKKYGVEKIILFGSRASKKYKEDIENSGNYVTNSPEFSNGQFLKISNTINRIVHSDVDLIVVGSFKGKNNLERAPPLYIEWELDLPVDFICYSSEEYKKLANQITIVREAIKKGIIIE